jgi:hypothetical protein
LRESEKECGSRNAEVGIAGHRAERRNHGVAGYWSDGVKMNSEVGMRKSELKNTGQSVEIMEWRDIGVMEYWKNGLLNGELMETMKICLNIELPRIKEVKLDLFPLLNPTLPYSITPALQHFNGGITQMATNVQITNNLASRPETEYGNL